MTARVVIEQIKALPPEEQAKVIDFLEEVKAVRAVQAMKPETFEQSAKRAFDRPAGLRDRLSR